MKTVSGFLATVLIVLCNGLFAQNTIRLDSMAVALGDSFEVPVYLSSGEDLAFIQIMVEYDTNYIELEAPDVRLGADAGAMQFGLMNNNLTFSPEDSVANRSFLFQLTGSGTNSVRGTDLEIAHLVFRVASLFPGQTRIHIDRRANHSALSTINLVDIPASQIEFVDGQIEIGDVTPPQCAITFPADSAELVSAEITITGTASDSGGSGLQIVELSFDGGNSFYPADRVNGSFENWQFTWQPASPGVYNLIAKAVDGESNTGYSGSPVTVIIVENKPELKLPVAITAQVGAMVTIPVYLENANDVGFIQATIAWDSLALKLVEILPGQDAPGFNITQINRDLPFAPQDSAANTNALFQLAGNGISGLSGASLEIAQLKFKAMGLPDSTRALVFDPDCRHTYITTTDLVDICSPDILLRNSLVHLVARDEVSGLITYYSNNTGVAAVEVSLDGPHQISTESDAAGAYIFSNLFSGTYSISTAKVGGTGRAVTASDALAIMQSTAFIRELNPGQKFAADVDRNGQVTGADALAVLRYSAFHTTDVWSTGQWAFNPAKTEIIVKGQESVDFAAYVLGDVTGNWQPNSLSKSAKNLALKMIPSFGENETIDITLGCATGPTIINALSLTINWLVNSEATPVFVPAKQLQFALNTETPGKSHLALASIDGFEPGDKIGHLSIVTSPAFADGVNLGNVTNISVDDSVAPDIDLLLGPTAIKTGEVSTLPTELALLQNYPNPFNMQTIIPFAIPQSMAGQQVEVNVLNIQGQIVAKIFSGNAEPGNHQLVWNGKDRFGQDLTSGSYLYRIRIGTTIKTRKLLLLK